MVLAFHGYPQSALWIAYLFFAVILALLIALGYALYKRLKDRRPELGKTKK